MLDRQARARLRTLSRENADRVARHLVVAGLAVDADPELAYAHAQAAVRRGGRVDVVREAAGLTAYATGRYGEALRELRAARRLGGLDFHRAIEADCERGLGRPERALAIVAESETAGVSAQERVELALVASGARLDLDDPTAALAVLDAAQARWVNEPALAARVAEARARALERTGAEDAIAGARAAAGDDVADEEVVVFDLEEDDDGVQESPPGGDRR